MWTLCGVGVAHAEPPDASASGDCIATLGGHVVDAATHDPVVAATISIDGQWHATSEAHGRFTLRGLCSAS